MIIKFDEINLYENYLTLLKRTFSKRFENVNWKGFSYYKINTAFTAGD